MSEEDRSSWLTRFRRRREVSFADQAPTAGHGGHGRPPLPHADLRSPKYRPNRSARRAVTTWQDEAKIKQLRLLAVELDCSMQALIEEGIEHILRKRRQTTAASS
jgi:hypothetical protein